MLTKILSICSHKCLDFIVAKPEDILTSPLFQDIRTKLVERGMVKKTQENICGLLTFRFGTLVPEVQDKIKLTNNLDFLERIVAKLLASATQEEINDVILSCPV